MRSALCILMLALLAGAPGISAQTGDGQGGQEEKKQEERKSVLYQWTDNKGVAHITDDLNKIPAKYRSKARRLETTEGTEETPAVSPSPEEEQIEEDREEREANLREEWQLRMRAAKSRLADAEQRYHALDEKKNSLFGSWGGPASGHLEDREEAARIEEEMKQVKKEIDGIRNEIEVVIPDEARKAGVPPGWLRE